MTDNQLAAFLSRVRGGEAISFSETMAVIDACYHYQPTAFTNGVEGDQVDNAAGENAGSCRILAFARQHGLDQSEALTLFGEFYRDDVLGNPEGSDHANIRTFMRHGWGGVHFSAEPLSPKSDNRCRTD